MSKGQRGNKESKKPKQAPHTIAPVAPTQAIPAPASAILERQRKKK
jgi:hypothetical protein